jgi:hypothetical protein
MNDERARGEETPLCECVCERRPWQMAAAGDEKAQGGVVLQSSGCAITERLAPVVNDRLCLFDGEQGSN